MVLNCGGVFFQNVQAPVGFGFTRNKRPRVLDGGEAQHDDDDDDDDDDEGLQLATRQTSKDISDGGFPSGSKDSKDKDNSKEAAGLEVLTPDINLFQLVVLPNKRF